MKYKMIVLDMDDTLLTDSHTISSKNKRAIKEAQEKGVYVVLASGRPTPAMIDFAKTLELDRYKSYIISFNGGQIIEMQSGACIFEQSLSVKDLHEVYDFSEANHTALITYHNRTILGTQKNKYVDVEISLTAMPFVKVDDFKKAVTKNCVKCLLLNNPDDLKKVEVKLKAKRPDLSIARSKPFFLEVMPKGIDKAATLKRLIDKLGVKPSEIIAVGNAANDLTMVKFAGLGVWVDNVTPELRGEADLIVASNNNDGVAEVITKYLL